MQSLSRERLSALRPHTAGRYARAHEPCVIFIDEIDAIGGKRLSQGTSADREIQRTLMELLNQLDGFDALGAVKIVMATNRPDILDPALMRSACVPTEFVCQCVGWGRHENADCTDPGPITPPMREAPVAAEYSHSRPPRRCTSNRHRKRRTDASANGSVLRPIDAPPQARAAGPQSGDPAAQRAVAA